MNQSQLERKIRRIARLLTEVEGELGQLSIDTEFHGITFSRSTFDQVASILWTNEGYIANIYRPREDTDDD